MKTLDRTDRDPFDRLAAARPTDESIASSWTPSRATTAFTHLRELADGEPATGTDSSNARHRARRWAVLGMAAAATAGVAVAATSFLAPRDSLPQASAVERLATAAAAAPASALRADQYLHVSLRSTQRETDPGTPGFDGTSESWLASDGRTWRRDVTRVDARGPGTRYFLFPTRCDDADIFEAVRPADYLQWPTEPAALTSFLRERLPAEHENNLDESQPIFEDLSDRFVSGATPPDLNAAMIRVLGGLPEVSTTHVRFSGRDAVKLEYRGAYVEAMYFERDTAQFLGTTDASGEMTMTQPAVVDEVPAEVVRNAKRSGNEDAPPGTDCY